MIGAIGLPARAPIGQPDDDGPNWFAVRCVVHHTALGVYEERITLWQRASFEEAIELAEREVEDYARILEDAEYVGLAQAYHLVDEPGPGSEIFSLMRESPLAPADYLTRFFDTGSERERHAWDT